VAPEVITALGSTRIYGSGEIELRALQDVDFDIEAGETVVLLAPSGCGRSPLLNTTGGFDQATSGRLLFNARTRQDETRRSAAEFAW